MFHIRVIIFFSIFLLFSNSNLEILIDKPNENHIPLAEFALLVTRHYISTKSNTVVIKDACHICDNTMLDFKYHLLNFYLINFDNMMALELYFGHHIDHPWDYYIFFVDNSLTFEEIIDETQYEREFYLIIFLTLDPDNSAIGEQSMLEIFKKCVLYKILHVVVVKQELANDGIIAVYTYSFTGGYCDESIKIVEVNQYKNGKLKNDYLFPPQTSNFHKCTLNISAHVLRPLLDFHGDRDNPEHLTDEKRLSGVEGHLLAILAKYFNFTIYLNFPKERSDIVVNGNSTGCFAELEANTAKIAIGAFSGTHPGRSKFSASVVYDQIAYIFAVRTGLNFGPLKQLAGPFCYGTWLVIGGSFLIALLAIKFISSRDNLKLHSFVLGPHNYYPYSNLLTIFLGNPISRAPRRNFARFLLMCWLLLTLVLRSAYQGQMFDSLRVSRRISTPKTISELLQRDYQLLSPVHVDYYPENKTIIMGNLTARALKTDSKEGLYTFISLENTLGYYNFIYKNISNLTFVPEPIYMHYMVMYFKKHSVLKYIFDPKIKRLMSAGIVSFIAKQHAMRNFQTLNVGLRRLPRIGNNMLQGLYVFYATLLGMSLLCFMLELLTRRVNKIKAILDSAHR